MQSPRKPLLIAAALFAIALFMPSLTNAQGSAPTDPQIAGIVVTANQIDIDAGKLAMQKSKDKQVRVFAQQMVTDHTALQNSVGALAKKLNLKPDDSPTRDSLESQAQQTTQRLKGLSGKNFDKAYIDNEVAFHKQVIDANKNVLMPNAKNAELKTALEKAQTLFEGHLQHAEKVQAALGGGSK